MIRHLIPRCWLLAALLLAAGCVTAPQTRQLERQPSLEVAPAVLLEDVPFIAQKAYQCGPAALAMTLSYGGMAVSAEALVPQVYVPRRQGSFQVEMQAAARRQGRLPLTVEPELGSLLRWLDAGQPVLVLQNLALDWYPKWHYAVAIGYDLAKRQIILHSGETARYRVSMAVFERTWQRANHWGIALLQPGALPVRENPQTYFLAAAALEATNPGADLLAAWQAGNRAWPSDPQLAMGLANHLYNQGNHSAARQSFAAIIRQHPAYAPAYNNLAALLTAVGLYDDAIATAEKGLAAVPGDPSLSATLAEARAARASH